MQVIEPFIRGVGAGGKGVTVRVAMPVAKSGLRGQIPKPEEEARWYAEAAEILTPMIKAGTATGVDVESSFAKRALETYIGGTPPGLNLGSDVCCHGAGVQVTTTKVYNMENNAADSPDAFNNSYGHYPRIYMVESGTLTQIGEMRGDKKAGLGRAGGLTGWDITRDLFGFALASFTHNFEALLGVFSERPRLPCTDHWDLPNLVYSKEIEEREKTYSCKIVEPAYAIPPASYTYSFGLPTPLMVLSVGTKCDEDVPAKCELWNVNKENLCDPFDVTFPKGENGTDLTFRTPLGSLLQRGFFNINPTRPMTVSYVNVAFPLV